MKWIKKGLIYCANQTSDWAYSHAAVPTPYRLNDSTLRIFCAFRDKANISRIGYVDVEADNPKKILAVSRTPVLDIGVPGAFDDNGVIPLCIMSYEKRLYLYYLGFQLGVKVPYFQFGGLAISMDGGNSFIRHQQTPILERTDAELFLRVPHHIIQENKLWQMWYLAGSGWIKNDDKQLPQYTVKYMESTDGIVWRGLGYECLKLQGDEHGVGRVYVIKTKDIFKIYYSIRTFSKGYRLGYAESIDGKNWIRKDDIMGLDVSSSGWDSQSVCYSSLINHKGKTYLFYNGNNYGETGFGYAELDTSGI